MENIPVSELMDFSEKKANEIIDELEKGSVQKYYQANGSGMDRNYLAIDVYKAIEKFLKSRGISVK